MGQMSLLGSVFVTNFVFVRKMAAIDDNTLAWVAIREAVPDLHKDEDLMEIQSCSLKQSEMFLIL